MNLARSETQGAIEWPQDSSLHKLSVCVGVGQQHADHPNPFIAFPGYRHHFTQE